MAASSDWLRWRPGWFCIIFRYSGETCPESDKTTARSTFLNAKGHSFKTGMSDGGLMEAD